MPLGILSEAVPQKSETTLGSHDTVFIISDGAAVISPSDFKELILNNKNASTEELSEKAIEKALENSPAGKHDDITVVTIRIK